MKKTKAYLGFLALNVPAIISAWFWLLNGISFTIWMTEFLFRWMGCSHEEFGDFRCFDGSWYGPLLDGLMNLWLLAFIMVFSLPRIGSMPLMFSVPLITIFFGTAVLAFAAIRRTISWAIDNESPPDPL